MDIEHVERVLADEMHVRQICPMPLSARPGSQTLPPLHPSNGSATQVSYKIRSHFSRIAVHMLLLFVATLAVVSLHWL